MHWRRKWQPTPVFLPRESQGRGSLVGCRLWGRRVGHDWSDLAAAPSENNVQGGRGSEWFREMTLKNNTVIKEKDYSTLYERTKTIWNTVSFTDTGVKQKVKKERAREAASVRATDLGLSASEMPTILESIISHHHWMGTWCRRLHTATGKYRKQEWGNCARARHSGTLAHRGDWGEGCVESGRALYKTTQWERLNCLLERKARIFKLTSNIKFPTE